MDDHAKKVLFVDDEAPFIQLINRAFKDEEFDILTAENGEKAIEVFRKNMPIPLIVTDFKMPGMNGADLIERLDEISSETRSIFVSATKSIVVSAHDEALDACKRFPEGKIICAIQKPVDLAHLRETIRKALKNI